MKARLLLAGAGWTALVAAGAPPKGALVLVVIAALLWCCRDSAGSAVTGHSHGGTSKLVAKHEAGHAAAARGLGGSVHSVRTTGSGGYTSARLPSHDPVVAIAFWKAGGYAAGSGSGCSDDESLIRRELRRVPSRDRSRVRREGEALGRKVVRQQSGRIKRYAETIERTGRL